MALCSSSTPKLPPPCWLPASRLGGLRPGNALRVDELHAAVLQVVLVALDEALHVELVRLVARGVAVADSEKGGAIRAAALHVAVEPGLLLRRHGEHRDLERCCGGRVGVLPRRHRHACLPPLLGQYRPLQRQPARHPQRVHGAHAVSGDGQVHEAPSCGADDAPPRLSQGQKVDLTPNLPKRLSLDYALLLALPPLCSDLVDVLWQHVVLDLAANLHHVALGQGGYIVGSQLRKLPDSGIGAPLSVEEQVNVPHPVGARDEPQRVDEDEQHGPDAAKDVPAVEGAPTRIAAAAPHAAKVARRALRARRPLSALAAFAASSTVGPAQP
mmetsp:Transcript_28692/g.91893  ORF Transcript_28692/g.91893 Transcript_28692/m.91893 type:complete len:328 (-) Transcript_28692:173-1156(-)